MPMIITVCDTCKRPGWDPETTEITDGAALAALVETAIDPESGIEFRRHSCLMGCDFGCNLTLQDDGKISYALGLFEPTEDAAAAFVDFAGKYAESETGQVPYKTWPQGVKGHFRARIPAPPKP